MAKVNVGLKEHFNMKENTKMIVRMAMELCMKSMATNTKDNLISVIDTAKAR